jgi:preprotein translocase subunit SecA
MLKFISKLFGGNKSEKDVQLLMPIVEKAKQFFDQYQSLTNDELRNKTVTFRERIKNHLTEIDAQIDERKQAAESLSDVDIHGRDAIYQEVDKLKKDRDKKIEEALAEIQPEAFAVVKETARRFKENTEIVATATQLDRDLSVKKDYITIPVINPLLKIPGQPPVVPLPGTWYIMMCS